MSTRESYHHRHLDNGVEFAALEIEGRKTTTYQIRLLAGMADEPADRLGLARLTEETITKGTERRSAQEVSDAFDAIGAQAGSGVGRESIIFRCTCLPEFVEEALALHAEIIRTPSFPEAYFDVAVQLALQELTAMEDDPDELSRCLIAPHAHGELLGRHELGTEACLRATTREDVVSFWEKYFKTGRMQFSIGGAVDVDRIASRVNGLFEGFGDSASAGRDAFQATFSPGVYHHPKELEQEHILICWPGVRATDDDYPVQRVILGVLSGGMSSRLFTEVREKQGLVYWVGAWDEHPRGIGRIFMGASTTPARCEQTATTLLGEVERLADDLTLDELDRAKVGIIAKTQTHGDITRARLGELSGDIFHFGKPIKTSERNDQVAAVTVDDVRRYFSDHPRDRRCVLTLGPKPLEGVDS